MLGETSLKKKRLTDAELENIRRKVRERFNQSDQQREDIDQQNAPSENIEEANETKVTRQLRDEQVKISSQMRCTSPCLTKFKGGGKK